MSSSGRSGMPFGTDPMAAWRQFVEAGQSNGGPTAVFVQQLEETAASIKERREQLRVLTAQLATFDEQLALFEASLQPVLEWSRGWLRFQEAAFDPLGLTKRRNDPPGKTAR